VNQNIFDAQYTVQLSGEEFWTNEILQWAWSWKWIIIANFIGFRIQYNFVFNHHAHLIDNSNNISFFDGELIFVLSFIRENYFAKLLCCNLNVHSHKSHQETIMSYLHRIWIHGQSSQWNNPQNMYDIILLPLALFSGSAFMVSWATAGVTFFTIGGWGESNTCIILLWTCHSKV